MSFRDRGEEFVVFDADGHEVDWYDPYHWHRDFGNGLVEVDNGAYTYDVHIPEGGSYTIRKRRE